MKLKKPYLEYTKEEIAKYRHYFVKNLLRRGSYRWPWRNIAERLATPERGKRACVEGHVVARKVRKMDHVIPVVDPKKGFSTWDSFIERLYVGVEGFQVMCLEHHAQKTKEEGKIRTKARQRAKGAKRKTKRSSYLPDSCS